MNDPVIDLHMCLCPSLAGGYKVFSSLTGVTALCP